MAVSAVNAPTAVWELLPAICRSREELGRRLNCPFADEARCCQHCRGWWLCDGKCEAAWEDVCERKEMR